jgi:hypothetical protein
MGTEVVGTLTHADAPQWGNAPHPACVYHAFFASATHAGQSRLREQNRVTLKTALFQNVDLREQVRVCDSENVCKKRVRARKLSR